MGWNFRSALKGKDSILHGIDFLNRYKIAVTARSKNTLRDFRSYSYQQVDGKFTNKVNPVDMFNHAPDATRYMFSPMSLPGLPNFGLAEPMEN
jgi:phage terminase large subunit